MPRLTTYSLCILLSFLNACKDSEEASTESVIKFKGFDDTPRIDIASEQKFPFEHFAKISREDFKKVYPDSWTINVSTNYYKNDEFIVSSMMYDWGAYSAHWSSGSIDYYVGGFGLVRLGLLSEQKGLTQPK